MIFKGLLQPKPFYDSVIKATGNSLQLTALRSLNLVKLSEQKLAKQWIGKHMLKYTVQVKRHGNSFAQ